MGLSCMQQVHHLCLVWQVEVPEWYVPGAVRATSPETPRLSAAVQASAAATQEVLAVFDITHGKQAFASVVQPVSLHTVDLMVLSGPYQVYAENGPRRV